MPDSKKTRSSCCEQGHCGDYLRRLTFWVVGITTVTLGLLALLPSRARPAPVPKHLFPSTPPRPVEPSDVTVGFRWKYHNLLLEVVSIDGTFARYVCVNHPSLQFSGLDGSEEPNTQSVARVVAEANKQPFPPVYNPENR